MAEYIPTPVPDVERIDGTLVHIRYEFKGFENEAGDPWTDDMDGQTKYEQHDKIPHACIIGMETDTDRQLDEKKREAILARADFWDPRTVDGEVIGWLIGGVRRTREWHHNRGMSVVVRERRRQAVPTEDRGPTTEEREPEPVASSRRSPVSTPTKEA